MGKQYIFTINDLVKKHGQKEILKNIWLSFYPGAKIGVLGRNGAGKSTLLRIMAGQDREFDGEARLADGFTAGYVPQEPNLNTAKDVLGNVEEAVAPIRAVLTRFDEINARLGEDLKPAEMDKLLAEQTRVQDQIDLLDAWNLDRRVEIAMDAMQLPPGDAAVDMLSGGERRRVALCKMLLQRRAVHRSGAADRLQSVPWGPEHHPVPSRIDQPPHVVSRGPRGLGDRRGDDPTVGGNRVGPGGA